MNSLQAQGIDKNGAFGSNLFNSINSLAQISQRSVASTSNVGTGNFDVSIKDTGKLTINDYKITFTTATDYTIQRLPDNTPLGSFSTTPPVTAPVIDGVEMKFTATSATPGDTFRITPTRNAAGNIKTEMTDSKRLAIAAPLGAAIAASGSGNGTLTIPASGQPTLTSKFDIYDAATTTAMQNGLKNSTPAKVVFGAVSADGASQTYQFLDAKGGVISSGTIKPGESNTLNLSIPLQDATGAPIPAPPATQYTAAFSMTIAGAPSSGAGINVSLSQPGSLDNRNGTALAGLQTAQTVDTGSASKGISLNDAYGKLVEGVGSKAAQGKLDSAATGAILANAKGARDSLSGVDLDEETGNLVKYQQYYTASSQIIKAAQQIFSTLINSL